jgi:hypothetical protein
MIWINLAAMIAGSGAMLPSLVLLAGGIARRPSARAVQIIAHQGSPSLISACGVPTWIIVAGDRRRLDLAVGESLCEGAIRHAPGPGSTRRPERPGNERN